MAVNILKFKGFYIKEDFHNEASPRDLENIYTVPTGKRAKVILNGTPKCSNPTVRNIVNTTSDLYLYFNRESSGNFFVMRFKSGNSSGLKEINVGLIAGNERILTTGHVSLLNAYIAYGGTGLFPTENGKFATRLGCYTQASTKNAIFGTENLDTINELSFFNYKRIIAGIETSSGSNFINHQDFFDEIEKEYYLSEGEKVKIELTTKSGSLDPINRLQLHYDFIVIEEDV